MMVLIGYHSLNLGIEVGYPSPPSFRGIVINNEVQPCIRRDMRMKVGTEPTIWHVDEWVLWFGCFLQSTIGCLMESWKKPPFKKDPQTFIRHKMHLTPY